MVRGVSGMQYVCRYDSPLGPMLLAAEGDWLTGAWFEGQKYFGCTLAAGRAEGDAPVLTLARRWLEVYFSGREPDFAVPLRPSGTPFQQEVWAALREIPYGQTTTYGAIARQMAARRGLPRLAAQAVGGAVGRNPICILVPCHRVLGADGSLTGYAGGVERKRWLLEMESPLRPCGPRLRCPAFAAPVAAGLQKTDRCPCSVSAASSTGRASTAQSRKRGRQDL